MTQGINEAFELLGLTPEASKDEVELAFGRRVGDLIDFDAHDVDLLRDFLEAKNTLLAHLSNERKEFDRLLEILQHTDDNIFILGRAGTGKSGFLKDYLKLEIEGLAACAFTGVAAQHIESPTIHSLFKIAGGPGELKGKPNLDAATVAALSNIKTLVIDEISMAPSWLIDEVSERLKSAQDPSKPFGGVRLIFVGDPHQLPPFIGKGEADKELRDWVYQNYKSLWFFDSKAFRDSGFDFKMFELTNVFRQDDKNFVRALDSIRDGRDGYLRELSFFNQRVKPNLDDHEVLTIATKNNDVEFMNSNRLHNLPGENVEFEGFESSLVEGEKFETPGNQLPVPRILKLKVGAQVMFTKNDDQNQDGFKRRWVNGTIGIVTAIADNRNSVFIRTQEDEIVEVGRSTWQKFKYQAQESIDEKTGGKKGKLFKTVVAEYTQIPLSLAWAVTVNKSQGKTYNRVHVDLGTKAFAEGMAYVALSRVRKFEGMTLERPVQPADIMISTAAKAFIASCQSHRRIV